MLGAGIRESVAVVSLDVPKGTSQSLKEMVQGIASGHRTGGSLPFTGFLDRYTVHIYILYYIILYYIMLCYIILMLYYIILYYSIVYYIILYCIISYYIVLYCIVLYHIVLYCIVLYYIILYNILYTHIYIYITFLQTYKQKNQIPIVRPRVQLL